MVEWPEAARGVGCGEGVSPSPRGEGPGEGAVSPPQKFFFHFGPQNGQFRRIVGADFYSSAACVTCKHGYVLA